MTTPVGIVERTMITVQELTQSDSAAWDAFVHQTQGGLPLHLAGWRTVLEDTYGYQTRYLMAKDGDDIQAVLPLFLVPSRLTGKRAMTMPGALCSNNSQATEQLLDEAIQVAAREGLETIVLQDAREVWAPEWQVASGHVFWLLPLPDSEEALWSQIDGNIRRQVRIARKNGLRAEVNRTGELLEPYYDMFCRFTHAAGTPVFSLDFLESVVKAFPDGFNIALIWHDETPVAGYFQLEMDDTVYGMWGAALAETLSLRPAYLALWEIMSDAIANGFSFLDMGRSPAGSNASKFKGQWGGVSAPVYQLTMRENARSPHNAVANQVQSDQRFQLFRQLWPKVPFSVACNLGPKLRWHIPFA